MSTQHFVKISSVRAAPRSRIPNGKLQLVNLSGNGTLTKERLSRPSTRAAIACRPEGWTCLVATPSMQSHERSSARITCICSQVCAFKGSFAGSSGPVRSEPQCAVFPSLAAFKSLISASDKRQTFKSPMFQESTLRLLARSSTFLQT